MHSACWSHGETPDIPICLESWYISLPVQPRGEKKECSPWLGVQQRVKCDLTCMQPRMRGGRGVRRATKEKKKNKESKAAVCWGRTRKLGPSTTVRTEATVVGCACACQARVSGIGLGRAVGRRGRGMKIGSWRELAGCWAAGNQQWA